MESNNRKTVGNYSFPTLTDGTINYKLVAANYNKKLYLWSNCEAFHRVMSRSKIERLEQEYESIKTHPRFVREIEWVIQNNTYEFVTGLLLKYARETKGDETLMDWIINRQHLRNEYQAQQEYAEPCCCVIS